MLVLAGVLDTKVALARATDHVLGRDRLGQSPEVVRRRCGLVVLMAVAGHPNHLGTDSATHLVAGPLSMVGDRRSRAARRVRAVPMASRTASTPDPASASSTSSALAYAARAPASSAAARRAASGSMTTTESMPRLRAACTLELADRAATDHQRGPHRSVASSSPQRRWSADWPNPASWPVWCSFSPPPHQALSPARPSPSTAVRRPCGRCHEVDSPPPGDQRSTPVAPSTIAPAVRTQRQ